MSINIGIKLMNSEFISHLISTGACVAAATWFLKNYITRRIQNLFNEREKIFEAQLRVSEKCEEKILVAKLEILPAITEAIYRSRNSLRDCMEYRDERHINDLLRLWEEFIEILYKYRVYIEEDTFGKLHRYKGLIQQSALMLAAKRKSIGGEELDASSNHESKIKLSDDETILLSTQFSKIENLYSELTNDFQSELRNKGKFIK